MRWQRPARLIVAVAGIGIAVALYVQTRERPVADRPPVATPADPEARAQSSAGTELRFGVGGDVEFEIEHKGQRVYPDGRTEWDQARLRVSDGTFLAADFIETRGEGEGADDAGFSTLQARGQVRLDTPEGASIRAEEATYVSETGVAVFPGAVTFARGRITGSGTGGEYHRDTGVFHLLAEAKVETAADEGGGRVTATGQSMTFNRATMALLLDGNAGIAHERQTMSAARATLYLAENQDQFKVIELRGGARVTPAADQEAGLPEMMARDIDLAFHDGTQALERAVLAGGSSLILMEGGARRSIEAIDISLSTAPDGRTVTRLDARDGVIVRTPPRGETAARTITASTLVASGDEAKGLTLALFTGDVRFVETTAASAGRAASERTGTSERLTMNLAGQLDAVEQARFERNVTFVDGDVTGDADLGEYDATAGRLILRPARSASRLPRVTSERVTVSARELIDIDLDSQDLHARGEVATINAADDSAETDGPASGLFNDHEVMYGFAAEFRYRAADGNASYRGTADRRARVTQGDTVVEGESIDLARESQDLMAEGRVIAVFSAIEGDSPNGTSQKYRAESDTLEFRNSARTVRYTGSPVTLTGPDGVTKAESMVMTLASASRTLERLDASTNVHSLLADGDEALADSLVYETALDRYTLRGQPVLIRTVDRQSGECSQARARVGYFTVGQRPEFPDPENPGGVFRRNVPCDAPLQK